MGLPVLVMATSETARFWNTVLTIFGLDRTAVGKGAILAGCGWQEDRRPSQLALYVEAIESSRLSRFEAPAHLSTVPGPGTGTGLELTVQLITCAKTCRELWLKSFQKSTYLKSSSSLALVSSKTHTSQLGCPAASRQETASRYLVNPVLHSTPPNFIPPLRTSNFSGIFNKTNWRYLSTDLTLLFDSTSSFITRIYRPCFSRK